MSTAEEREFSELTEELVRKQRAQADLDAANEPKPIGPSIERSAKKMLRVSQGEPDDYEAREERRRRENWFNSCSATLGKYRECHLAEYEIYAGEPQKEVRRRVGKIWDEIDTILERQMSIIFWGTLGTGKDYLASCLLLRAATRGIDCKMLPGRVFYAECAAAFADDSTQLAVYRKWEQPKIICLSDPVFEAGWKPQWGEYLNNLIRMRYDAGKATWATVNARDENHAAEMFGFDVWDRLLENAVVIPMRWESFRKRKSKESSEF